MSEVQDNLTPSISIGVRPVWNLKFADDIDLIVGTNTEFQDMTNQLSKCARRYGMEISSEKSKVMVNSNDSSRHADITLNDNKLEEVNKLCYLGTTLLKDGSCETDIRIRLDLATSAMIRLYVIWNSRHIHCKLKYNVYSSLILSILTYGCEA